MGETRKVGERGQVTIPKEIRERENIRGGDEVEFEEEDGKVVMKKKDNLEEKLIEGYKAMGEEQVEIAEEMLKSSPEAIDRIENGSQ